MALHNTDPERMRGVPRLVGAPALAALAALAALCCCASGALAWVLPAASSRIRAAGAATTTTTTTTSTTAHGLASGTAAVGRGYRMPVGTRNLMRMSAAAPGSEAKAGAASYDVDVAIIGGGPAGSVMAALLAQQHQLKVVLMDPKLDQRWIPNYGVWLEEWRALEKILGFGLEHCLMKVWPNTDLFCGGSHGIPVDERLRVQRAYGRVDRAALKNEFRSRALAAGALLLPTAVDAATVAHTGQGSTLRCQDGTQVSARMIVDCSGYSSQLVQLDGTEEPGVQIAYGIECEVDACPYDENAMTLMDYRTDYFGADAAGEAAAAKEPTFMYAMPMGPTEDGARRRVFFEETSLVARPPMSFDECKVRMDKRLAHLGVKVLAVEEEEFCYIPMGGPLPKRRQRVVAFGGAMALVHPSTGFQICRCLAAAGPAAKAIAKELRKPAGAYDPDAAATAVYDAVWAQGPRLQRDFMVFGGEFLMRQDAANLRGFFDAFFRLPLEQWTGFLAGWPGLPNNDRHETWDRRLVFGLGLWILAPLSLKLALMQAGVLYGGLPLIRSVTPLADLLPAIPSDSGAQGVAASGVGGGLVEQPVR